MSSTPIEAKLKTWIGTTTAAGSRVYSGARLQSTELPAIVIEVNSGSAASLYVGTNGDLDQWDVSIRAVAETAFEAQNVAEAAVAKINAHSDFTSAGKSVCYEPTYRTIEEPVLGEGDEAQPAICTATVTILHRI